MISLRIVEIWQQINSLKNNTMSEISDKASTAHSHVSSESFNSKMH